MSEQNGGTVRTMYVGELGSADGPGEYGTRAVCRRCVPTFHGPKYLLSNLLTVEPTMERSVAAIKLRDLAIVDILRHADSHHHGIAR